ncbi:MAG: hypothetical protein K1X67_14560 [Fimbriimonadaceae bacterium]|nr:hypothetical protein [Fimbriimonadaceae bacterium]
MLWITGLTLLCLTMTGGMAYVIREAPKPESVRLIDVRGCRKDSEAKATGNALLTIYTEPC